MNDHLISNSPKSKEENWKIQGLEVPGRRAYYAKFNAWVEASSGGNSTDKKLKRLVWVDAHHEGFPIPMHPRALKRYLQTRPMTLDSSDVVTGLMRKIQDSLFYGQAFKPAEIVTPEKIEATLQDMEGFVDSAYPATQGRI